MSQQGNYYPTNRLPYPQGSSSSASSMNYSVRPLPTPGSLSSVHSPYSPPSSATSSRSPPPTSASSGYSNGRYTSGNVQSPEAIDDVQRSLRWGSPSNNAGYPTTGGRSASGGGNGNDGMNAASFSGTNPNFHAAFEKSQRGTGTYRDRREGSSGSIVSPSNELNRPHSPNPSNHPSQYSQHPSQSNTSPVSSLSRQYPSSSATPQPSAPPLSPSASPVHGASPSPTSSRSPLRHSASSNAHEPLPPGTFITATADHESLSVVPLSGLNSVEAIKELIMSRLHISDEDMPRHEFYLTRIGGGEGRRVGDEELWNSVRSNSSQVTVFVKNIARRRGGGRRSESGRESGDYGEDSEDDFGVGMSAERMRQVSNRRERQKQSSSSISSRSDIEIDEFGQATGQRVSPGGGGTERLRSDRPSWTQQSASWGHSSRGVSASEGALGAVGGTNYPATSPPMERSRSGGSVTTGSSPREYTTSNNNRPGTMTGTSRDGYFSPPLHQGSNQVVIGPSGPTRRLPPQPQPPLSTFALPDHAEMTAHNQMRQRMQTAPSIQVSSPAWNQTIAAPTPSNMPLPPSPQPSSTHQMLTRTPGPGSSPNPPNPRALYDPRSNLPQYTSQPYKNLPLPNSPYHNLSLQSSYQPGSSTVGITYVQPPPQSTSSKLNQNLPYNVQQQDRLSAQQKMMSKSADNLRGHYATSPQRSDGFDDLRPPIPPPIPPQYLATNHSERPSQSSSPSNHSFSLPPPPPPASAFYSSPVQAQQQSQARSQTTPALAQTAVPRRPLVDQVWNQPRPSTMYDLSTGQVGLQPGEVLQQTYTGGSSASSATTGGGSRRRSDHEELSNSREDRRRESSGSASSASAGHDRRRSRDLKSQLPPSLLAGGGTTHSSSASSPTTTTNSPSSSAPPFADDDGLYDGLDSPDRYQPTPSARSSASASGPFTPSGDPQSFVSIPSVKSSSQQGPKLDEFGDPIDEETSTWFPVGQVQPQLSSSLSSGVHPSPFSPSTHSPLSKSSTTVPLPASSPYGGPASSPMKQQYSSSSSGSAPSGGTSSVQGGGSSSTRSNHDRNDSVPNAQDWQQTILSRFGASNLSDANEESTLMASGTLRPFDTSGTSNVGLGVAAPSAPPTTTSTPKLLDEFGDELEDDATFFPGFGPAGAAPSTPQGQSLRLDGMYPSSPTSPHHKRPNLRVTIDGSSPGGGPVSSKQPPPSQQQSQQQQHARASEPSPPSGSRSSRKPQNPRLDELVRFSSSPSIGRRNSFAAREKDEKDWAIRPPVETVLENLDVFFPEHDLDKPVFDLPTPTPSTPSTGSSPVREAPPSRTTRTGSAGTVGGPLGYRKSIRVVAQDRKRMLQKAGNNVARAVSGLGSNLLRRRSTKLFGARIEEVTSAQMKNINAIKETSDDDPDNFSYKWIKGDLIGRGTYGHVYIALSVTTGETIAVKQVEMPRTYSDKEDQRTKGMISSLKAEIELLKDLDHPNIVLYLGMEQTHEFLSIFLEYVPGGSVGRIIRTHGKFEENVIKFFTLQILDGLEYLHSLGILHRDMKADNILIDQDGMCKISDFGTSKKSGDIYQNNENMSMQGSIFWMAPEVIHNDKRGYSAKADIWSLGCICIEMLAGSRPWEGEGFVGAMFKLGAERMRPPLPDDVERSAFAEQFVSNCLQIEPDRRPKASEAKHHPFLLIPAGWSFTHTSLYHVMTSDRLPSTPSAAATSG